MSRSTNKPYFSIILPTYNVGKFIDRCIESCIAQSYGNFEILVVDDCGDDDSIVKAHKWEKTDTRVRIITCTQNTGTFHARFRGVQMARGQYVIFLDPDDTLNLDATRVLYSATRENDADIVFFGVKVINNNPGKSRLRKVRNAKIRNNMHTDFFSNRPSLGTPGKAYRREIALEAFSILDIPENNRLIYGEDALFLLAALIVSKKGLSVDKPLYEYYVNETSISTQESANDINVKANQLDNIILHIRKLGLQSRFSDDKTIISLINRFASNLSSDRHIILRHSFDETGSDLYYSCISAAFREKRSIKNLARIFIYFASLRRLRL